MHGARFASQAVDAAAGARARGGNAVASSYARQAVPSRVELAEERAREVAQLATALGAEGFVAL